MEPGNAALIEGFMETLRQRGRSPKTRKTYRGVLERLCIWLDAHGSAEELVAAQSEDLELWRGSLTVAPNTVATYGSAVRSFYTWARRRGLVDIDPALDLELPPYRRGIPRPIGERDLELAVQTAPKRIRPWLVLAGYAGLRAGEIAVLERRHTQDSLDPPMIIFQGKGGRWRAVPLTPYVWSELLSSPDGVPRRGFWFPRYDGKPGPVNGDIVSQQCNTHLHELGLDHTVHSLRHRFGTRTLKASGGNLRVPQTVLGHASIATTQIYTAISDPEVWNAVAAVQPQHSMPNHAA